MRVLFSTSSPASYMLPPQLGDEQVVCGPDWPDDIGADGRVRSLATPVGSYDLAMIAAKLPPEQRPDVVVCLVDASWRNTPANLAAFGCPRVLLVADTHHLNTPLLGMLRYMGGEPFDRVIFLYDRHHLALFRSLGLSNAYWFPGLTFAYSDAEVKAARRELREPRIAFVGQAGKFHPRRTRLLAALTSRGLPLAQQHLPQRAGLEFYGASLAGFNASLNGDLNLRIFEILAAGAGLLTDRLGPESGLAPLLTEGREFLAYGSETELTSTAAGLMANPAAARELGAAGARWFDHYFNETARRASFQKLVFDGAAPFPFSTDKDNRVFFGGDPDRLIPSLMVYEGLQEQHRTQETVRVAVDAAVPADILEICATLPRVVVSADPAGADWLVVSRHLVGEKFAGRADRIWCWDATADDGVALAAIFSADGLVAMSKDVALFGRVAKPVVPAAPISSVAMEAARARRLFEAADYAAALEIARAVLQRDGRCVAALAVLGDLALLKKSGPLAEKIFRQARGIATGEPVLVAGLAEALVLQGKFAEAETLLNAARRRAPAELRLFLALANLREAQGRSDDVIAVLAQGVAAHPASVATKSRLGVTLRRHGRVLAGLGWQRRALGASDPIAARDPAAGPVRVVFIVQHPQGWTCLESVWRAMADDPAFSAVIMAAPYQHPYPPEGGAEAIYAFLTKAGVPFIHWDKFPLEPGFADVVFVQNPYDVTRPKPLHVANLIRLVPRLAYVPYEIDISGGETTFAMLYNYPLQNLAWAVFARSERHRRMFARYCGTGDAHVEATGHPKMDQLPAIAACRDAELARWAAGRKIVLWNPHWEVKPDGTVWGAGCSTFMRWRKDLLSAFARRPGLALVIRPHPLFFGALESCGVLTRREIAEFQEECAQAGGVWIDRSASYHAVFAAASAILSDASSFLLEFAATGKPVGYLHNPRGRGLTDDGAFVRDHCATVETDEALEKFLDDVSQGHDPRRVERQAALGEFLFMPPEGVGMLIKGVVARRLAEEAGVLPNRRTPPTFCSPMLTDSLL